MQRTLTSGVEVGIDRLTNKATNVYTVITQKLKDGTEVLKTAFPGKPSNQ